MKKEYVALLMLGSFLLSSCTENTENLVGQEPEEPIENVSYADKIQPIFNSSCGGSGCHVGGSTSGVNLSGYSQTMNSVGSNYGTEIVVAGNPDTSPLVDKIEPSPALGSRMPLGGTLTTTEILTIRTWISEGAENN